MLHSIYRRTYNELFYELWVTTPSTQCFKTVKVQSQLIAARGEGMVKTETNEMMNNFEKLILY